MKVNSAYFANFRQWMLNMSAVVKRGQVADKSDAPDRPPSYEFDQAVVHFGGWGNHHSAAGEFAVIEGQEKAGATVNVAFAVNAERKRATPESRQAEKDGGLIPDLTPIAEAARPQGGYVGGKSDAENIDVVEHAIFVGETKHVAFTRAASN